jgi:hypothetical protein
MAELNYQPDFNDAKEQSFEPVPAGDYIAVIENSDYLPTSSGSGNMLKLTYQIIDGPAKGKKLFEQLNLENQSQQAVQIAKRALNALCVACGMPEGEQLKDSAQLHNIPLKIVVGVRPDNRPGMEGQIQNNIKKHLPLRDDLQRPSAAATETEEPAAKAPAKKTAAPAATTAKKDPPWKR